MLYATAKQIAWRSGYRGLEADRVFGVKGSDRANTVWCVAHLAAYQGFLRTINSGLVDSDFVRIFKQFLFEKLYLGFVVAKATGSLSIFRNFWGNGLFRVQGSQIDIRL